MALISGRALPVWAVFFALALTLGPTGGAAGSIIDYFLRAEDLSVARTEGPGSVRLDGMARLELVVEDENNEINLIDYGRNRAGVVLDKDRWSVETWSRFGNRLQDPRDVTRRRFKTGNIGAEVIYRNPGQRAYGGSLDYRRLHGSRNFGDTYQVKGNAYRVFYNERPFSWLTAAISASLLSENEDRTSKDVYALAHEADRPETQLAAAFLHGPLRIGATWTILRGEITGIGEDNASFHTDVHTWSRPQDTYSAQVIYNQGRLQGGAYVRRYAFEGGEEAEISWSDRFPMNGSQENFALLTTTFTESVENSAVGTRWMFKPRRHLRLGASLVSETSSSEVSEAINFKGTRRAHDIETSRVRLGGGAGATVLNERVQLGLEAYLERGDETDRGERRTIERTWESRSVRLGMEYFWRRDFVVRGGVVLEDLDLDVDEPASRRHGGLYTFGASYLPRGGVVQIDAAVGFEQRNRAVTGSTEKVFEELTWGLALRYII
ncbi:MAG: hypothetical protein GF355_16560 [Candidatus Eisenbacteria bacterium]|nr:hypothetical protein [Candidatus Eisenbacteria bacterium]